MGGNTGRFFSRSLAISISISFPFPFPFQYGGGAGCFPAATMITFVVGPCRFCLGFSCFALLAFGCLFWGDRSGAFFLGASVLHELAHVGSMVALGTPPAQVRCTALGCRIITSVSQRLSYFQTACVSLAGPAANILVAMFLFVAGLGSHPFAMANLVLGVLHILPIEPLDGGLALRAVLCRRFTPQTASRATCAISLLLLLPLATLGFLLLLYTRYNFTLLFLSVYLMLYFVLREDLLAA